MTLPTPLRGNERTARAGIPAFAAALLTAGAMLAGATLAGARPSPPWVELRPAPAGATTAVPPLPGPEVFPVQFVLDDDNAEGSVGATQSQFAKQFLWFNRFTSPLPFQLEEVWVLFPTAAGVAVGDAVEIVLFEDADADPSNGAVLRSSLLTTVQVADGNTFSIYPLGAPLAFSGGDILIGVVPRYVVSGVTPPTTPAAIDTTSDGGRSWIALWAGDPPSPVSLPADNQTLLIGAVVPGGGNWMIRGFGTDASVLEIPTLGIAGLVALAMLLGATSVWLVRRRNA